MLQDIVDNFVKLDKWVSLLIMAYLQPYSLETVDKEMVFTLPIFIKLTLYLLIFLIPFLIIKFFYPFKKTYNFLLMFILFLITMSVFGIFLGFFQLLYS